MQFLSGFDGMGRYFETPQAYNAGERFEIQGADGDYRAPVGGVGRYMLDDTAFPTARQMGMGRYFETPAAYAAGERFEIEGADGDYNAPVGGMGRYFEDGFGLRNKLGPFEIQSANKRYKAMPYGGTMGLGQADEGLISPEEAALMERLAGKFALKEEKKTHPALWVALGAAVGIAGAVIYSKMR